MASKGSDIVAKVNGVPITNGELRANLSSYIPQGTIHGRLEGRREELRKEALENLIIKELIYQEAVKREAVASDKEVEEYIKAKKETFPSKKEFERALVQAGLTIDVYRKVLKRDLTVKSFKRDIIRKEARYSEKELRDYYWKNMSDFRRPESYRVWHIFINIPPNTLQNDRDEYRKRAEELFDRIKSGEDFASVAYESSEDDYRVKGGDLGWVHTGRLWKEVEDALKKMKIGELRIVESLYGYHVLLLKDRKQPQQMEFDEVRDSIRSELEDKRYKEKKNSLIKKLKDRATIEVIDKR